MIKFLRWTSTACFLAVALTGCARYKGDRVEERYRMFFSTQADAMVDSDASPDLIAAQYAPSVAVTASFEELAAEGFSLKSIEPIAWGDGATIFTFQRKVAKEDRINRTPIHFTGTFRTHPTEGDPVYYAFEQYLQNYTLHMFHKGGHEAIKANWEGRELYFEDAQGLHTLQLSPEGDFLFHLLETDNIDGQKHDRTLAVARRITTERTELSLEDREVLRMEGKIARQTPYGYDPYPWHGTFD